MGQALCGGSRQACLAQVLPGIEVLDLVECLGRLAAELMERAETSDVVDAALIALAADGDIVYTPDVGDLKHLAEVRGLDIDIVRV